MARRCKIVGCCGEVMLTWSWAKCVALVNHALVQYFVSLSKKNPIERCLRIDPSKSY